MNKQKTHGWSPLVVARAPTHYSDLINRRIASLLPCSSACFNETKSFKNQLFFYIEKFQLINAEGLMELENRCFDTFNEILDLGNSRQGMRKPLRAWLLGTL